MSKISVIIPSYNAEKYIKECIQSVVNQTLQPYEILICDDASKDRTREIISEFVVKYPNLIKPFFHETNIGASKNFNFGMMNSRGTYLSLIAGDDTWEKEKLELEYNSLVLNNSDWVYSRSNLMDENGNFIKPFDRKYDGNEGNILAFVLTHKMALRNFLFKRELIEKVGVFDEKLDLFEDWDFKIKIAKIAKISFVDQYLINYRKTKTGLSSSNKKRYLIALHTIYKKYDNLIRGIDDKAMRREIYAKKRMDYLKLSYGIIKQKIKKDIFKVK